MMKLSKRQSTESERFFIVADGESIALCKNEDTADALIDIYNQHFELLEECKKARDYVTHDLTESGRKLFWSLTASIQRARGDI
jgi:hypothetical protein